jgi:CDP-diacylglycerol--glycerol-3-phosphate 3-phosphatidyltransferase/cardiolipin synthase
VILVRELGITFMRMGMLKYEVMPASRGGKLKTVLQSVAISMFLLPRDGFEWFTVIAWVVLMAAFVLTVVTGLEYVYQGWKIRRDARSGASNV